MSALSFLVVNAAVGAVHPAACALILLYPVLRFEGYACRSLGSSGASWAGALVGRWDCKCVVGVYIHSLVRTL